MAEEKTAARKIVRVLATDVAGTLPLERALRRVRGVGFMVARNVCVAQGIDRRKPVGTMTDEEIKAIEAFIKAPAFPAWMYNRRKDPDTGSNLHLSGTGLDLARRNDINMMKKMRSYKGVRHDLGQPVRGQRTRGSFRTNKSVGVAKKKAIAAKKAEAK